MALNAVVYKALLQVADLDRNYYRDFALTLARHPSETDERMMVRLLAFGFHAQEGLSFGRGVGVEDEPDLFKKDLTGAFDLWIEVGRPDERSVRQASRRSGKLFIYAFGGRIAELWWEKNRDVLERLENLTVMNLPAEASLGLASLAQRNMELQCTIQEGEVLMGDGSRAVRIKPAIMKA